MKPRGKTMFNLMKSLNCKYLSQSEVYHFVTMFCHDYYFADDIDCNKLMSDLLYRPSISTDFFLKSINAIRKDPFTTISICSKKNKPYRASFEFIRKDLLLAKIKCFSGDVVNSFVEALEKRPKYLIVDLTDSIGGNVNSTIDILSHLLCRKQIVTLEYRNYKTEYFAKNPDFCVEKIVLIVNGNTLSAAEIFAYSLLENHSCCILLGSSTYGKQYGQTALKIRKKEIEFVFTSHKWLVNGKDVNQLIIEHSKKTCSFTDKDACLSFALNCITNL